MTNKDYLHIVATPVKELSAYNRVAMLRYAAAGKLIKIKSNKPLNDLLAPTYRHFIQVLSAAMERYETVPLGFVTDEIMVVCNNLMQAAFENDLKEMKECFIYYWIHNKTGDVLTTD